MNHISKTINKAVFIQIIGTILLGSVFYALFFSVTETVDFFKVLWFPLFVGFFTMFFSGKFIGNSFKPTFNFKVWHGIAIIFALLFVGIIAGVLAMQFLPDWHISDNVQTIISLLLIFLTFGGLPTLIVCIWLGYKLCKTSTLKT
ncbi:hypothetical protein [Pedobacter sp. SL55]|uniref:hypothetical protein n=1 Tax=Pedobacter sp. SL55 TaxID=2995161 RepID=UPI00226E2EE9|nr:hypothetical protein [Pedobacter sp. SL55]WAC42574.1 hypothetical protein OVA16_09530 [Pedobacter sp. SL55]